IQRRKAKALPLYGLLSSLVRVERKPGSARIVLNNVDRGQSSGVLENQRLEIFQGKLLTIQAESERPQNRLALIPSGLDLQVHLRVPGQEYKEEATTGVMAALHGGYAGVLTMPNTAPVIDSLESLALLREKTRPIEEETGVEVFASAAISKSQAGQELV